MPSSSEVPPEVGYRNCYVVCVHTRTHVYIYNIPPLKSLATIVKFLAIIVKSLAIIVKFLAIIVKSLATIVKSLAIIVLHPSGLTYKSSRPSSCLAPRCHRIMFCVLLNLWWWWYYGVWIWEVPGYFGVGC